MIPAGHDVTCSDDSGTAHAHSNRSAVSGDSNVHVVMAEDAGVSYVICHILGELLSMKQASATFHVHI